MEIPKTTATLIDRRERLANQLLEVNYQIDDWLEKHGADFTDPDLSDGVSSSAMIYFEPENAKKLVINYIEQKLNSEVK